MLIDEVLLQAKAGSGGNGLSAFRREKFVERGGPWGGNGGHGGAVFLEGIEDIGALRKYRNAKQWRAEDGAKGGPNKRTGKNGKDLTLYVPVGTYVSDYTDKTSFEITQVGQRVLIARGGQGGRGNWEFATAINKTPDYAEEGHPGDQKQLKLELRLIADVGFIGLPNVGKSSLLNALTNAEVKVANYPFTTLEPNIGMMNNLILADIPGLIEGASKGKGLGSKFLRHISRTRMIVHCISSESADPVYDYELIQKELQEFDGTLLQKEEVLLLTKSDTSTVPQDEKMKQLKKRRANVLPVSIYDEQSLETLRRTLIKHTKRKA